MSNSLNKSYSERTNYDKLMNYMYNPTIESYKKRIPNNQLLNKVYNNNSTFSKEKIENLKICGTGNADSSSSSSSNSKGKLKAVNYFGKIWNEKNYFLEKEKLAMKTGQKLIKTPFNKKIIIKFMKEYPAEYDKGFKNTYADGDFSTVDKINGYEKFYDPYEKQFFRINTNEDIISAIIKIVKTRIEPLIDLEFSFNSPEFEGETHVRIALHSNSGCWSKIGTDCLSVAQDLPTMNFAWFDVGTVLHEFGHVLGLAHEHQTPLGNPIIWNLAELYPWALKTQGWLPPEVDKQIIKPLEAGLVTGTLFDFESIMLYFYPREVTLNEYGVCCGSGTTQNIRLSPIDVLYWNYLYPIDYTTQKNKKTPFDFYKLVYNEDIPDYIIDDFYAIFYPDSVSTS